MKIYSWNVLHMIHEINYSEESLVLERYKITDNCKNEQYRLNDIFKTILNITEQDTVVCLQEVPGDLLARLNQIPNVKIFAYKYPREPRIKSSNIKLYEDKCEYLVTIIHEKAGTNITQCETIQFDYAGKACQITKINQLYILNVHIPFVKLQRNDALNQIFSFLINKTDYVIIGDMNMSASDLKQECLSLNQDVNIIEMEGPTRKERKNGKLEYRTIDHAITNKKTLDRTVYENEDMSDHFMIFIEI